MAEFGAVRVPMPRAREHVDGAAAVLRELGLTREDTTPAIRPCRKVAVKMRERGGGGGDGDICSGSSGRGGGGGGMRRSEDPTRSPAIAAAGREALGRGVWRRRVADDAAAAGGGGGGGGNTSVVVKAVSLHGRETAAAAERELRVLHELCSLPAHGGAGAGAGGDGGDGGDGGRAVRVAGGAASSFLVRCLGVELERESATLLFVLEDARRGSLQQVGPCTALFRILTRGARARFLAAATFAPIHHSLRRYVGHREPRQGHARLLPVYRGGPGALAASAS